MFKTTKIVVFFKMNKVHCYTIHGNDYNLFYVSHYASTLVLAY